MKALLTAPGVEHHRVGLDGGYMAVPPDSDQAFLDAVREIRKYPRLDFLVERWPEMNERHARPRAPEIERRLGRRVPAADDHCVLEECLVSLAVNVRHVGELFADDAKTIGRTEITRCDYHAFS